jgi:CheY-like chemotaxis protein
MSIYILVAAANANILTRVREVTAAVDCHLVVAPSMSLALFLVQKNKPALIISDLALTDGDGLTFIQEIKSDEALKHTPFIFLLEREPTEKTKRTLLNYDATKVLSLADHRKELINLIHKLP